MNPSPSAADPFPPSEFDQWAGDYDQDVIKNQFPFTGYSQVLDEVVRLSDARPGMSVLDLGAGTGNLSEKFLQLGCELWCTDFSTAMLELARPKLSTARFFLHDLRQPFPPVLMRRFDRIVSAYVFHHFDLPEKVALIERLMSDHLVAGGHLIIADLSFPTCTVMNTVRQSAGEEWDEEPYWISSEALPALETAGLTAAYTQVSDCAGIYHLVKPAG